MEKDTRCKQRVWDVGDMMDCNNPSICSVEVDGEIKYLCKECAENHLKQYIKLRIKVSHMHSELGEALGRK